MKNLIYIDSSYIFLNNKTSRVAEKLFYDDSDKEASLKYLFKKFKDNKYLNKDSFIAKLDDYDECFEKYLSTLKKIDILSLNLKEHDIEKIITDKAIYKFDKLNMSFERTSFDINLYSLDKAQLYNYIVNQANNTDGKVLVLLKIKELEEISNAFYFKDLFNIVNKKYKKAFNYSMFIDIVLDIIIVLLLAILLLRVIRWEAI